ncbi:hypothetical protein BASA81_010286 [Batrachochytrium salamandrivorans]|nr:hypothetical protein BASA81_010286 [Batrachochytrium salamandrivorans]
MDREQARMEQERRAGAGALLKEALQKAKLGSREEEEVFSKRWRELQLQLDQELADQWRQSKEKELEIQRVLLDTKTQFLTRVGEMERDIAAHHQNRDEFRFDKSASPEEQLRLLFRVQARLAELTNALVQGRIVCAVCLDQPRAVLLVPCNHFACCLACSQQLKCCPICRATISQANLVHFA